MQHTLYLNRSRVFISSFELLPPNERERAGGWWGMYGIGVTVPPASTVSTACSHRSNSSSPRNPTMSSTGLTARPYASIMRDRIPTANRTTNMTRHELGYELWILFFFFGPNFFFFLVEICIIFLCSAIYLQHQKLNKTKLRELCDS